MPSCTNDMRIVIMQSGCHGTTNYAGTWYRQ